jgi:hypothetical protein
MAFSIAHDFSLAILPCNSMQRDTPGFTKEWYDL